MKVFFPIAGQYQFNVKVVNINGLVATATSATIKVTQTASYITVYPPAATVNFKSSKQYSAVQYDQFGIRSTIQPAFNWSISPNTNVSITNGKAASTSSTTGTYTVTASAGSLSGKSSFAVIDTAKLLKDAITNIKHVIIIMQENRSFDNYFGKFKPGNNQRIDTIPTNTWTVINGITYLPGTILSPTTTEINYGHDSVNAEYILNNRAQMMHLDPSRFNTNINNGGNPEEIYGMHTGAELPAYSQLAKNFVLQDRMFEPAPTYSKVAHLYMYSGWSATKINNKWVTCVGPAPEPNDATYGWNSLGKLIWNSNGSWGLFQGVGWTKSSSSPCGSFDRTNPNDIDFVDLWGPIKDFDDVLSVKNGYIRQNVGQFFYKLATLGEGSIPKVSWIIPMSNVSDHAGFSDIRDGHAYVVSIIQGIMNSPLWKSCAIFLAWDDWGGFYDHVVPPTTDDGYGYGIRVPGLLISPFAKQNVVDNQTLSFDAYLRFIEDLFCNGARVPKENAATGQRPSQRENDSHLGNLLYEFDFSRQLPPITNLPCGN